MEWRGSEPQKAPVDVSWVEEGEQELRLNINGNKVPAKKQVQFLGVEIDKKLTFDKHVLNLCQNVNKKISAFLGANHFKRTSIITL